jgi:hypothetical protein
VVHVAAVVNSNEVLDGHVALDLDCLDRLYLNAYIPNLQVGGQVVTFLTQHLGNEVPSPALVKRIGDRFRQAVAAFAQEQDIPLLRLKRPDRTRWDDRKLDHVRPHLEQAQREGRHGVVAIVAAQEVQKVFMGYQRGKDTHGKAVNFGFDKADRAVTVYYFYILDGDFGPGFIKQPARQGLRAGFCAGGIGGPDPSRALPTPPSRRSDSEVSASATTSREGRGPSSATTCLVRRPPEAARPAVTSFVCGNGRTARPVSGPRGPVTSVFKLCFPGSAPFVGVCDLGASGHGRSPSTAAIRWCCCRCCCRPSTTKWSKQR